METKIELSLLVTLGINPTLSTEDRNRVIESFKMRMFEYAKAEIEKHMTNVIRVDRFTSGSFQHY